jgi:hypothetical protein
MELLRSGSKSGEWRVNPFFREKITAITGFGRFFREKLFSNFQN